MTFKETLQRVFDYLPEDSERTSEQAEIASIVTEVIEGLA